MSAKTKLALLVVALTACIACGQTQFNMGEVGGISDGAESYLPHAESMGSNWEEINCAGFGSGAIQLDRRGFPA